jgi:hypothetical protein
MAKKKREKRRQSQHQKKHPPIAQDVQKFFVSDAGSRLE